MVDCVDILQDKIVTSRRTLTFLVFPLSEDVNNFQGNQVLYFGTKDGQYVNILNTSLQLNEKLSRLKPVCMAEIQASVQAVDKGMYGVLKQKFGHVFAHGATTPMGQSMKFYYLLARILSHEGLTTYQDVSVPQLPRYRRMFDKIFNMSMSFLELNNGVGIIKAMTFGVVSCERWKTIIQNLLILIPEDKDDLKKGQVLQFKLIRAGDYCGLEDTTIGPLSQPNNKAQHNILS